MSENVTPLTSEHLRIMRDDIAQFRADITKKVDEGFSDVRKRLTHVEHSILGAETRRSGHSGRNHRTPVVV